MIIQIGPSPQIIIVAGQRYSGRSNFMMALNPIDTVWYAPRLATDRKELIQKLQIYPNDSIIAIESELPGLVEKPNSLINQLGVLARLRKHTYILEWTIDADAAAMFARSTYCNSKQITSIFHTIAIKKDDSPGKGIARFRSIAARVCKKMDKWVIEYQILKNAGNTSLPTEVLKYHINEFRKKEPHNAI